MSNKSLCKGFTCAGLESDIRLIQAHNHNQEKFSGGGKPEGVSGDPDRGLQQRKILNLTILKEVGNFFFKKFPKKF